MRVIAVVAALLVIGGNAEAAPRKHRHKKHHAASHARKHQHEPRTSEPQPMNGLDPQLQITQPHASAEPREAPPTPPQDAPPPAQLDTTPPNAGPPNVARADLAVHVHEAPPPAELISAPAPRPSASSDLHRRRRWGLVGGGLAMLLVGYGADVGLTYGLKHTPATTSLIPFVGPLLQMRESWAMVAPSNTGNTQVDGPANQRIGQVNSSIQTAAYAVLGVDCAIQLIGTGLTVAGVVGKAPTKYASIEPGGGGLRVRF